MEQYFIHKDNVTSALKLLIKSTDRMFLEIHKHPPPNRSAEIHGK